MMTAVAPPTALSLTTLTVPDSWLDYNGHMSEAYYLMAFGESTDAFLRRCGIDERYRNNGFSFFTRETYLHHRAEIAGGERLRLSLHLIHCNEKRLHLYHMMHINGAETCCAIAEQILVHVDLRTRKACPMPAPLWRELSRSCQQQEVLMNKLRLSLF